MALKLRWHCPADQLSTPPTTLRAGYVGREERIALTTATGDVHVLDGDGRELVHLPRFRARAVAIAADGLYVLCRGALFGLSDAGEVRWKVGLEANSVGRLFIGSDGDVVVLLSRRKRFLMERYHRANGTYMDTKTIERRRGMLSRDGLRLWTRNRKGISAFSVRGPHVARCALGADGSLSERGALAVTTVGDEEVACVHMIPGAAAMEERWRIRLGGRNLHAVAVADGLDVEDEESEFEAAELGRPALTDTLSLVPDRNGSLHALDLGDGSVRWRFEGKHYPTMEAAPMPLIPKGDPEESPGIFYLGTDEVVYRLSMAGELQDLLELPAMPEGPSALLGNDVVTFAGGLLRLTAHETG